nr:unnamed protein product [Spirometra erinaceieuropaei]
MKRKYYGFPRSTIYKRLLRQRRAYYAAMEEQPIASKSSVANESPEMQMPQQMPEVSTELPVVAGTVDTVEGRCLTTDLREFGAAALSFGATQRPKDATADASNLR